MKTYFVTGCNRGIGSALCARLLQEEDSVVFGIGRRKGIEHPRFRFEYLDLSQTELVEKFKFSLDFTPSEIHLINNAGVLGPVAYNGNLEAKSVIETYQVNVISLHLLCNSFIKSYQHHPGRKTILNISSGAARYAIDAWSAYCSSKAGVDMLTRVINVEQKSKSFPVKAFAVAPGVVDTDMQSQIREVSDTDFSKHDQFVEYKTTGALLQSEQVADKLVNLIYERGGRAGGSFCLKGLLS